MKQQQNNQMAQQITATLRSQLQKLCKSADFDESYTIEDLKHELTDIIERVDVNDVIEMSKQHVV